MDSLYLYFSCLFVPPSLLVYFISYCCFPSYFDIRNIPVQALENWIGFLGFQLRDKFVISLPGSPIENLNGNRVLVGVLNRPVRPSLGEEGTDYGSYSVFFGVLGRTTPGRVRAGRTIGDYSLMLEPSVAARLKS